MLGSAIPDRQLLGSAFDYAFYELSNRGLVRAARWAIDAAAGLGVDYPQQPIPQMNTKTMQAKAYFDCKEYGRAWFTLCEPSKSGSIDQTGRFLRLFARYHQGEALKEDEYGTDLFLDNTKQEDIQRQPMNPFLEELASEIGELPSEHMDAHIQYLQGVIFRAKHQYKRAIKVLTESCVQYPYNWSCWAELKASFTRLIEADRVVADLTAKFSNHSAEAQVMLRFFLAYVNEDLHSAESAKIVSKFLIPLFPKLALLQTQMARIYNSEGHYDAATSIFERILKQDPFRMEDLDTFSNLLFVTDQRSKLAYLAQHVSTSDKYRTESCCIIANYYSLKGEHERAVIHYKRAIVLNRNYMAAWTLMGHEFVELGNPQAAIETYQMGTELTPYDFRSWFGLGQAYEVLSMYNFSQYYYQRALALRPEDVRLWDALASCYQLLEKDAEALNAFQQAYQISEGDVYYGYRLGLLHERLGNKEAALRYITACAQSEEGETPQDVSSAGHSASGPVDGNTTTPATAAMAAASNEELASEWPSRARLWLAKRAMNESDWTSALHWVRKVHHGTREMLEEARAMEHEVRHNVSAPAQ